MDKIYSYCFHNHNMYKVCFSMKQVPCYTNTSYSFAMHGLRFPVCGLLVTVIVLSVQGDILQLQSGNQIPWTNCGEFCNLLIAAWSLSK